jgi:hypothetical protein
MVSPTARTLQELRRQGFLAAVVERWLPRVGRKADLWGIGDILAVHLRERQVLLVQVTTAAHVPDRLRRIQARPEMALLLRADVLVEVWGWRKVGDRWRCRKVAVRAEDLQPVEVQALPKRRQARRGERQRTLFDVGEITCERTGTTAPGQILTATFPKALA